MLCEVTNNEISSMHPNVSPLRTPRAVKESLRGSYIVRKRRQLMDSFSEATSSKLSKIDDTETRPEKDCNRCEQWTSNFREAIYNCRSKSEKIRLTILPKELTKQCIFTKFPGMTLHIIDQARKLKLEEGVYQIPDPYNGNPIRKDEIQKALEYYLNDDLDCSRQSPKTSDVISVNECGQKMKKVKRFMTRSIGETYHTFRENNPQTNLGK